MPDEMDKIQRDVEIENEARLAIALRDAAKIPAGVEGNCKNCGDHNMRLVNGYCAGCRDEFGF